MKKAVNVSGVTFIIIGLILMFASQYEGVFIGVGFFVSSCLLVVFNNLK